MCSTRLAANAGPKSRQKSPSRHHRTTLSGYIFATKAPIDNRKKLLSSNISSTCPHNIHTYIHTYIIKVIVSSHTKKTERLCITKVHIYTNKLNLKRWVFRARRKEGCESMSLMLTGRLFQMSGPQTEKARRPNCVLVRRTTADLAVVDRS